MTTVYYFIIYSCVAAKGGKAERTSKGDGSQAEKGNDNQKSLRHAGAQKRYCRMANLLAIVTIADDGLHSGREIRCMRRETADDNFPRRASSSQSKGTLLRIDLEGRRTSILARNTLY